MWRPKNKYSFQDLGYKTYREYLNSPQWKKTKERFLKCKKDKCCIICENSVYDLHHICYDNCGHEDLSKDLVALCREHHKEVHEFTYRYNLSIEQFEVFILYKLRKESSKYIKKYHKLARRTGRLRSSINTFRFLYDTFKQNISFDNKGISDKILSINKISRSKKQVDFIKSRGKSKIWSFNEVLFFIQLKPNLWNAFKTLGVLENINFPSENSLIRTRVDQTKSSIPNRVGWDSLNKQSEVTQAIALVPQCNAVTTVDYSTVEQGEQKH